MNKTPPVLPPKPTSSNYKEKLLELNILEINQSTIPNYLNSLPLTTLKELTLNHELLLNFLIDLNYEQLSSFHKDVITQVEKNLNCLAQLREKLVKVIIPKDTLILQEFDKLNLKFKNQWSVEELKMYNYLNNYSLENLINLLNIKIKEINNTCNELYVNILQKYQPGEFIKDNDLSKFVSDYRQSRKVYHLRKENLYRYNEGKFYV
ncbi:hypothetical protein PACTADRAFT_34238 [Pachysolen tannophilus NRRL Y-2460]|uniref:VPS37 C-terminal domain-containing protein n=1 Tax=Pachysolen tannophilus NRRL Y-2460 TaxID=669874 RepID=A0A1E4TVC1_PACTA|nr:hypothetical protein PACTADRAFT_34238 [Pachysolen tannophilus NRRL Y-2460]